MQPVPGPSLIVLLGEEIEELPSLKLCFSLRDEDSEHFLNMLELQGN